MLSKEQLIEYNNRMLNITFFDEKDSNKMIKDFCGYNIPDYHIMKHLLFIPKEELTDKDFYTMSATLTTYQNKQLKSIKKEIEETNKHYRELLGLPQETIIKQRTELKGRNKKYIPDKYKSMFNKDLEIHYIDYDPIRDEVILDFDSDTRLIRNLHYHLEAKWLPHKEDGRTKFYFKVSCDYLPYLIFRMKNATKQKHFEPDINLYNFISVMKIDLNVSEKEFENMKKQKEIDYKKREIEYEKNKLMRQIELLNEQLKEIEAGLK